MHFTIYFITATGLAAGSALGGAGGFLGYYAVQKLAGSGQQGKSYSLPDLSRSGQNSHIATNSGTRSQSLNFLPGKSYNTLLKQTKDALP